MSSISLCVIATGKYTQFLPKLFASADKYFLDSYDVRYKIFTDAGCHDAKPKRPYHFFAAEHLCWPLPTLLRFHRISRIASTDFIFYIDADMEFVRPVGDEILGDLVAVQHPGFFGKPRYEFTYETNPRSRAYIPAHEGTHYFAGGFQGGSREHYGKAMAWMRDAINEDLRNHVIPVWHDESVYNRYLASMPPTVILSPDYCSTPQMRHDTRRIVALDKDHGAMRA